MQLFENSDIETGLFFSVCFLHSVCHQDF